MLEISNKYVFMNDYETNYNIMPIYSYSTYYPLTFFCYCSTHWYEIDERIN